MNRGAERPPIAGDELGAITGTTGGGPGGDGFLDSVAWRSITSGRFGGGPGGGAWTLGAEFRP